MPPSHGLPGLPSPELRALRPSGGVNRARSVWRSAARCRARSQVCPNVAPRVENDMLFVQSDSCSSSVTRHREDDSAGCMHAPIHSFLCLLFYCLLHRTLAACLDPQVQELSPQNQSTHVHVSTLTDTGSRNSHGNSYSCTRQSCTMVLDEFIEPKPANRESIGGRQKHLWRHPGSGLAADRRTMYQGVPMVHGRSRSTHEAQ